MKLYDEVLKIIEDSDDFEEKDFFYEEIGDTDEDQEPEFSSKDIKVTMEEREGGYEGSGEVRFTVYSFERGDERVYIQFDGWYASHYGSEYESCFQVTPEEVTVIQWALVKD